MFLRDEPQLDNIRKPTEAEIAELSEVLFPAFMKVPTGYMEVDRIELNTVHFKYVPVSNQTKQVRRKKD